MRLVNLDTGEVLAEQVNEARTFLRRLKGLLFTKTLAEGNCLHIEPCRSIHTFFMNYAIDVLYLDAGGQIVAMEKNVEPGRTGGRFRNTASVVELPAGSMEHTQTKIGQTVQFYQKGEIRQ